MGAHRRHRREAAACCAACAASARRRPRGRPGRPAWTWLAVLGAVWALVPVAALTSGDGTALAAPAPAERTVVAAPASAPGAPAPRAPVAPPPAPAERVAAAVPAQRVAWRESVASGTPNAGRLVRGVQLPVSGRGFYTYDPATQAPPGGDDRRWGTDHLVREVLALGVWWDRAHPGQPRLGVGDLSRPEGGAFTGPGVGHVSHQNGRDVDIRLPRSDGAERGADPASYDRALTQALVDRLVAQGAELVLIGPSLDLAGPPGVVMPWPNHDGHLHVRFPDPDGPGN